MTAAEGQRCSGRSRALAMDSGPAAYKSIGRVFHLFALPTANILTALPLTSAQTERCLRTYRGHARLEVWGFFVLMIPLVLLVIWFETSAIDQALWLSLMFRVRVHIARFVVLPGDEACLARRCHGERQPSHFFLLTQPQVLSPIS